MFLLKFVHEGRAGGQHAVDVEVREAKRQRSAGSVGTKQVDQVAVVTRASCIDGRSKFQLLSWTSAATPSVVEVLGVDVGYSFVEARFRSAPRSALDGTRERARPP